MKNTFKKVLAMALSLTMATSVFGVAASAANVDSNVTTDSSTMTIKSVMNLSKDAVSAPNAKYTYTLTNGAESQYAPGGATQKVFAGKLSADQVQTVEFATTDYATVDHTVTKTAGFSFAKVDFAEPGVYHFILTETADGANANVETLTDENDRTRDVYVVVLADDTTAGAVVIDRIIMSRDEMVDSNFVKSNGFVHSYGVLPTDPTPTDPEDPTEPKEPGNAGDPGVTFIVTDVAKGTMANRSKDFAFATIDSDTVAENTVFKAVDADGNTLYVIKTATGLEYATLTTGANETATYLATGNAVNFDLKHSENFKILSVVTGMKFTTTISDAADDGYKFWVRDHDMNHDPLNNSLTDDLNAWTAADVEDAVIGGLEITIQGSDFATVKGQRDVPETDDEDIIYDPGFPDTGVVLDVVPFALMAIIAAGVIGFRAYQFSAKRK